MSLRNLLIAVLLLFLTHARVDAVSLALLGAQSAPSATQGGGSLAGTALGSGMVAEFLFDSVNSTVGGFSITDLRGNVLGMDGGRQSLIGSGDTFSTTDLSYPAGTGACTVAVWIKPSIADLSKTVTSYIEGWTGGSFQYLLLTDSEQHTWFGVIGPSGSGYLDTEVGAIANTWSFECVTWDGSDMTLTVNNQTFTTANANGTWDTTAGWNLLGYGGAGERTSTGSISAFRAWNRALSPTEVAAVKAHDSP